ncbi:MAG: hypothetical protein PWQ88_155 [Candidatus Methanomethylophilaceae archaeon]|nr:hypothetical protein [Candidatus Methanomethylophilaceae archaeon]MDI3541706.1 hypothetical protein [Candidatus Methanomethylophilaceae archaeon]
MVVKEKRGRRRYVIFEVDKSFAHKGEVISEVSALFRARGLDAPYVIDAYDRFIILRTSPEERDKVIDIMSESMDIKFRPLRTSGTIKTLRERYPPTL